MQISFSSKTFTLTDTVRRFIQTKLERLGKFSSLDIRTLQVVIDRVKRGGKTTSATEIEVIAEIRGKRFAFKEIGENFYQAFYRVYDKVEKKLRREIRERKTLA